MVKPVDTCSQLTREQLKKILYYDPWTGWFTWIAYANGRVPVGSRAGAMTRPDGYVRLGLWGGSYLCHRLAWFYVHGVWPKAELDHINHDRSDNRIVNLREADRVQNTGYARKRKDNTTGLVGVSFQKDMGKYVATYNFKKKRYYLGTFDTAEEASAAYQKAIKVARGEFAYREAS